MWRRIVWSKACFENSNLTEAIFWRISSIISYPVRTDHQLSVALHAIGNRLFLKRATETCRQYCHELCLILHLRSNDGQASFDYNRQTERPRWVGRRSSVRLLWSSCSCKAAQSRSAG